MKNKRSLEGYLLIDQRNAPPVPESIVHAYNQAHPHLTVPILKPGEIYESATISCSHCQVVVVLNPNRSRERAYCAKCDHYICDACAALPECYPMARIMDEMQEASINPKGSNIWLSDHST